MDYYGSEINKLIDQLETLPGIGRKSAQRLAFHVIHMPEENVKALSEALFINGSYLLRLFKSRTGQTLLGYHNRVRCDRARALLRDTDMSISEVGEAVGFVSSAHFSHVFRKTTGMTPTECRCGLNRQ